MQLSIIVLAENNADTLALCLKSCLSLEQVATDLIVVDRGSSDATLDYAQAFPVKPLRGDGQRLGTILNLALEEAQSPWVGFIFADCVVPRDWPARLVQRFEEGVVGAGGAVEFSSPGLLSRLLQAESEMELERGSELARHLMPRNALYRRDVLLAVGGFDPAFRTPQGLHRELAQRLQARGGMLRAVPGAAVQRLQPWRMGRFLKLESARAADSVLRYKKRPRDRSLAALEEGLESLAAPYSLVLLLLLPCVVIGSLAGPYATQWWGGYALLFAALLLAHLPMTLRLIIQTGPAALMAYPALAIARDVARGLGVLRGGWRYYVRGLNA
jgi:hypothetical protein